MNRESKRIFVIILNLLIIWTITKFFSAPFSLPFWFFVLYLTRKLVYELTSVLIVSELYIGVDTFFIGPFSIIQLVGALVLVQKYRSFQTKYLRSSIFILLILISIYFSISYYTYFRSFTFAGINWIFIFFIVLISFKGTREELIFVSLLIVYSISLISLVNLVVDLLYGLKGVRLLSFGNPNQIGFFSLFALAYIITIYPLNKHLSSLIKILFWFNCFYVFYTGSRLNMSILIFFFFFLYFFRVKDFWLTRRKLLLLFISSIIIILIFGGANSYLFRNHEDEMLKYFSIKSLDDLNDTELASFTSGRSIVYYDAIQSIKENPFFGNGFLSWNDKNNVFNSIITNNSEKRLSMHSTFLQYLTETGVVGLFLYLLYLIKIALVGVKFFRFCYNIQYYFGITIFLISIFMVLGSTLDNHSISYAQVHFLAALSLIWFTNLRKNKNNETSSILY